MKFDHTTKNVDAFNAQELKDILVDFGYERPQVNKMKKEELVERATQERDRLVRIHEENEKAAAAHKAATILNERERMGRLLDCLETGLSKKIDEHMETISKFQSKVAETAYDAAYEIKWRGEDIMFAYKAMSHIAGLHEFVREQEKGHTLTISEFTQRLWNIKEDCTRRCIESTSYTSGRLEDIAEHKALQYYTRLMRNIFKTWESVLEDKDAMALTHLYDC